MEGNRKTRFNFDCIKQGKLSGLKCEDNAESQDKYRITKIWGKQILIECRITKKLGE